MMRPFGEAGPSVYGVRMINGDGIEGEGDGRIVGRDLVPLEGDVSEDDEWAAAFAARTFSAIIPPEKWEKALAALDRDIAALGAGLRVALSLQLMDDRSMEGQARRDRAALESASGHLERAAMLLEELEALLDTGCERVTVTRARVAPESL